MDTKFKIGERVTIKPLNEDEAQGVMDGVVVKIQTEWPIDDGLFYLVELDNPLPNIFGVTKPPTVVDAAEWELTTI